MKQKTDDIRSRIAALDGTPLPSKLALRGMESIKSELSQ